MRSNPVKVHRLVLALPMILLTQASAWADDDDEVQPPPPPPPAARPVYQAPLSQTTQATYVPQSIALSGPEEITDFDPTRPVPDGYTLVHRQRKGLIIGGGVTLGVTYGICMLTAAIGEDIARSDGTSNGVAAMWIPVAGPFIQAGKTANDSATGTVFLLGLGGAQVAGAVMLYYGLTTKKPVLVRNDIVGSLTVAPMAGAGASGLSLSGRF